MSDDDFADRHSSTQPSGKKSVPYLMKKQKIPKLVFLNFCPDQNFAPDPKVLPNRQFVALFVGNPKFKKKLINLCFFKK